MTVRIIPLETNDLPEISSWFESDPNFPGDFSPFSWKLPRGEFLDRIRESVDKEESYVKFYASVSDKTVVGLLLTIKPENFDYYEIGYYVVTTQRGKGVARESVRQLMELIFESNSEVMRIEAGTSSLNLPSQKLLESLGFVREAVRRKTLFRKGKWEDSFLYSFVRDISASLRQSS